MAYNYMGIQFYVIEVPECNMTSRQMIIVPRDLGPRENKEILETSTLPITDALKQMGIMSMSTLILEIPLLDLTGMMKSGS